MTQKSRAERASDACRWLAGRIAAAVEPGAGNVPGIWEQVAAPSDAFMDVVSRWEAGDDSLYAEVKKKADAVVAAWHAAYWQRART